jgi:putative ABC transport system permease protein
MLIAASGSVLSGRVSFADVALALSLVAASIVVSRVRGVGLEGDITLATVRSFVQLLAIGFVLDYVFRGHGALTLVVLVVMVGTATLTSGRRGRGVPGAYSIAALSISIAAAATLGLLVLLRVIPTGARAVIPLGSMIIASAMNTTSLVMTNLRDGLAAHRREVEARLSLAQTGHQAGAPWHRAAMRTAMLPTIDQTKVVGLVALPGAMTGMILAGASAAQAIRVQLVVMYMLLGGNAFAALTAGEATMRRLFTADHQLVRALRRVPS